MSEIEPIHAPVFTLATLLFGSGAFGTIGWLSLFALSVLAMLVRLRVLPLSGSAFCAFAHVQGLFFLMTVGIHGFIISYAILCSGPPPLDYLMSSFGRVLISLATGLIIVTGMVIMVRLGSRQKPSVMPGAWLQASLLAADFALLLAMQMIVFSHIG